MITKLTITLLATLLLLSGCDSKEATKNSTNKEQPSAKKTPKQEEIKKPEDRAKSEEKKETSNVLTLTAIDGKTYSLEALEEGIKFQGLEGKVVILDFFATWCPPCRAEMPHLVHLQEKYKGKIQILSVLMEEDKDNQEVIAFAKEHQINFPVLNSKENFLLSQALGGIRSLPTLVMYDKTGNYFIHYTGAAPEEMIESDIKKALAK